MRADLDLIGRAAWAPGLESPADWEEWAAGRRAIERSEALPDLPFLPSLFKRRLGQLDRMTLLAGHEALAGSAPRRVVLATRRGEIGQQYRIGSALAESGEVSPSAFSLSVFNAPVSLLSIAERNAGAACAVHAGEASFAAGLCCCIGMLAADPEPVLLVAADEPIPEAYEAIEEDRDPGYALALLLGPAGRGGTPLFAEAAEGAGYDRETSRPPEPEALAFLRWILAGSGELRIGGSSVSLALSLRDPGAAR